MTSMTAAATVTKLMAVFAAHGLPERVVTDNGPQFISQEFKDFMQRNGVVHILFKRAGGKGSADGQASTPARQVRNDGRAIVPLPGNLLPHTTHDHGSITS